MNKLAKRAYYFPLFLLLQFRLTRARRRVERANMRLTVVCYQKRAELVDAARDMLDAELVNMGSILKEIGTIWD